MADDWTSVHWRKLEYLISCGLRPWYLDNTDPGSSPPSAPQSNFAPTPTPNHTTPQAPHVLQQQQQQPNQPAGQQQAWAYPVQTSGQNVQPDQSQSQQWQSAPNGGTAAGSGVQAVVKVGQPWQSSPGRWQCDVNITLINKGVVSKLLFAVCDSSAIAGSNCFLQQTMHLIISIDFGRVNMHQCTAFVDCII